MANEQNELKDKPNISRCRYVRPVLGPKITYKCTRDRQSGGTSKPTDKETCQSCPGFKSRYIEYPLTVNHIDNSKIDFTGYSAKPGALCAIRPCAEEYKDKTYLGIYIGDLPFMIHTSYDEKTGTLKNSCPGNPAIFVFALNKVILGMESWWHEIESPDELKDISDQDISSQWYVELLNDIQKEG